MYIPKNRIVTNLRTTQNEFVYKSTGESYNGVYWKDYKGKFYAGTNPNVTPRYEIIRVIPIEDYKDPYQPKSQVAITEGPTPFINEDDGPYDEEIITTYARLKKVDTINPPGNESRARIHGPHAPVLGPRRRLACPSGAGSGQRYPASTADGRALLEAGPGNSPGC